MKLLLCWPDQCESELFLLQDGMIAWNAANFRPGDETGIQSGFNLKLVIDIDLKTQRAEKCPGSLSLQSPTKSTVSGQAFVIFYDEINFSHS